jgi:hypothetical protein
MREAEHSSANSQTLEGGATPALNEEWFIPKHAGARYYSVLSGLHATLKPRSYLEVGIRQGHSIALAKCPSIGIDPRFELDPRFQLTSAERQRTAPVHLFETTSDKFFESNDPRDVLKCSHVDFLFLDGMHQSDFLLRDIINAERAAGPDSMIALHDCVPIDIAMTLSRKERAIKPYPVVYPNFWAGDVWRIIPMLKKYRPELKIHCMDAHPTGLVLLTGLDGNSTVLRDNYDQIVAEMNGLDLAEVGLRKYVAGLPLQATADFLGEANLRKRFKVWSEGLAY